MRSRDEAITEARALVVKTGETCTVWYRDERGWLDYAVQTFQAELPTPWKVDSYVIAECRIPRTERKRAVAETRLKFGGS